MSGTSYSCDYVTEATTMAGEAATARRSVNVVTATLRDLEGVGR